jgi:protein TonB
MNDTAAPRDDSRRREIIRWSLCFVLVLMLHGGAAALALMAQRDEGDYGEANAIPIELTAATDPTAEPLDVAPGPPRVQQDFSPAVNAEMPEEIKEAEKVEKKEEPEEKPIEMPPIDTAEVTLPTVEPVEKVETPVPTPAQDYVETTTAPTSATASPAELMSWERRLAKHLQNFKRYPRRAHTRGEKGTVQVRFIMDRTGKVVVASLLRGSGSGDLDAEAVEMVRRAQPLPKPPPGTSDAQLVFSIPVNFSIK